MLFRSVNNPQLFFGPDERCDHKKVLAFFGDAFKNAKNPEIQAMTIANYCTQLFGQKKFVDAVKTAKQSKMLATDRKVVTAIDKVFERWEGEKDGERKEGDAAGTETGSQN